MRWTYAAYSALLIGLVVAATAWACDEPNPFRDGAVKVPVLDKNGAENCTGWATHKSSSILGTNKYEVEHTIRINCTTAKTVDGRPAVVTVPNCFTKLVNQAGNVISSDLSCEPVNNAYKAQATKQLSATSPQYTWEVGVTMRVGPPPNSFWTWGKATGWGGFCGRDALNNKIAHCWNMDQNMLPSRTVVHNID